MSATLDVPSLKEIEADFREWSFHLYYRKSYANEPDLTLRFCKALAASCQPIRDRAKLIQWWRQRERDKLNKRRKPLQES